MKTKDIFSLAVRLLGLVFLYQGLQVLPGAAAQCLESIATDAHQMEPGLFFGAIFMVGWPLFVAQWLVRGAPMLMRRAYPETSATEPTVSHAESGGCS